jgi:hypothetical protein
VAGKLTKSRLTKELAEELKQVLLTSQTVGQALDVVENSWGWRPGMSTTRTVFRELFGQPPSSFLRGSQPTPGAVDGSVQALVFAVRKGASSLEDLCDVLHLPPAQVRGLASQAAAEGYSVDFVDEGMVFYGPRPRSEPVHVARSPVANQLHFAVISDTHCGSKFARTAELGEFIHQAYDAGCRDIFHPGDIIDGIDIYKGQLFELVSPAVSDQINIALDSLPALEGLSYHFITGNHDETVRKLVGMEPGRLIEQQARSRGRSDMHHLGAERAQVFYGGEAEGEGINVELFHPGGGGAYALSYKLQKYVEGITSGTKPQIMLVGHFHSYVKIFHRNIWAFQCPAFQSQTPFLLKFGKNPTVGGLIMEVDVGDDWSILRLSDSLVPFYMGRLCRD